jgi:hypothetical protein
MITKVHPDHAIDLLNHAQNRIDALKTSNSKMRSLLIGLALKADLPVADFNQMLREVSQ